MYKMIFLSFLLIGYNRLMAQDNAGQLVYQKRDQKMLDAYHGLFAGMPAGNAQSKFLPLLNEPHFKGLATQFIKPASTARSFFLEAKSSLPGNAYTMQSGWACRQEWKLEKITGLPLRLRLGSKDQVDWLEGKYFHH
jgi:hypothetical protein